MSDRAESRALVPAMAAGARVNPIVPTTFAECMQIAELFSRSSRVPTDYRGKPEDCCIAILHGLEVGLAPMQALQSVAVINGRPSLWGDGALAVVRGSGLVESFEETDDGETATCIIKRRGDPRPIVRQFSTADAKLAQLAGKAGPWTQYPRRMRQMRARSWALRDGFADVLKGLHVAEEAHDIPPMLDITPPAAPPEIPDAAPAAPPAVAAAAPAPLDIPGTPDPPPDSEHQQTDAGFLAGLDGVLGSCANTAAVMKTLAQDWPEVEERGVEQAAQEFARKHVERVYAADPKAQEADYKRVIGAMRGCVRVQPGDAAATALKGVVDYERVVIGAMPERWQNELRAEYARVAAKIKEGANQK